MDQCRRQLKKVANHDVYLRQIGDELCSDEAKLFRLVKSGTVQEVQDFLKARPHVDKNKVNEACHTILQEAVCRRDLAMVEVLLDNECPPCAAVELAAQIGAHDILDVLLAAVNNDDDEETQAAKDNSYVGTPVTEVIPEELTDSSEEDDAGGIPQPMYYSMQPTSVSPKQGTNDDAKKDTQPADSFTFNETSEHPLSSPSTGSDGTSSPSPLFFGPIYKPKRKCPDVKIYQRSPSHQPVTKRSPDSSDSRKPPFQRSSSWSGQSNQHRRSVRPRISDKMVTTTIPAVTMRKKSITGLSIQPLINAATEDDYKGTELLIKIGCKIPEPHEPSCMCSVCKKIRSDHHDLLHDAINRLEKYRALTSAAYIILTSPDPILTSLERSDRLACMAAVYPENKDEFEELSRRSSCLAVELLATCKSEKEVVQLLMRECGLKETGIFTYGRLQLAVGLNQKEFVTNSTCQHALYSLWLGPNKSWLKWSTLRKFLHVSLHLSFAPLICTAYVLVTILPSTAAKTHVNTEFTPEEELPKKSYMTLCREDPVSVLTTVATVPLNRFIYAASAYIIFLALLLYSIVQEGAEDIHPETGLAWYHWLLFVWVVAHVYKIAQDFYTERFLSYWTSWWTLYELIMMAVFSVAACCFVAARIQVIDEKTWRVALVAEGLFAIGTTLSFMRTLQWMHLSQNLGPVIISFSRMTAVIGQLFIIFLIVVLSFSTGLYAVYQNFRLVKNNATEEDEQAKGLFISYTRTLRALFWAIFGHGEADYADIPEGYEWHVTGSNVNDSFLSDPNESFPVAVGYALWGLFHVAFVIVLLNMLIAVMTNCFQKIQDNFDVEWKFARTKLWMYYLEDHNAVPPPFNLLLPLTGLVALVARKLKSVAKRKKTAFSYYTDEETVTDGRQIELTVKVNAADKSLVKGKNSGKKSKDHDHDDAYTKTMTTLVNRFVQNRNLKEAKLK